MRIIVISLLAGMVLASCATANRDWKSNDLPGVFTASFAAFNNEVTHTVDLARDEVLFVKYSLTARSGKLILSVSHDGVTVWQKKISGTGDTSEYHLMAPSAGRYSITVSGRKAAGSFDIRYTTAPPKTVQVKTNRNIELFGLMMVLDDGPDQLSKKDTMVFDGRRTVWAQWYSMVPRNYEKIKAFDTCRVMSIYRKMQTQGYSYHFFIGFLLQVDAVPFARINSTTDQLEIARFSPRGDMAEATQKATAFLDALNSFSRAVDLDAHLAQYKPYYDLAVASVAKNVPRGD
ncbi:MAG: hypothetical protein JST39_01420, partial [Bacteroidetes bacterium]|nr:hypothetical protein [Bacteroidota bacterium]